MPQKSQDNTIRADKLISSIGLCSRRGVEDFIKKNKVEANNVKITEHGQRIPKRSVIKINGREIKKPKKVYYLLNKPKGIVSTASDEYGRRNVVSLIPTDERIFPVGRLDKDTHGLIILTNDGDLTNKLIHPKYHIGKTYILKLKGLPSKEQLEKLKSGIELEDGLTAPSKVKLLQHRKDGTFLEMIIYEGRKRQIRRMCEAVKLNLVDLQRVEFGNLTLEDLKVGEYRELKGNEVEKLKKLLSN
jgi:23S rRNA pseudouridine2605 synthase